MPAPPSLARWIRAALAVAGVAGLALTALSPRVGGRLYEDERDFGSAAVHLARDGVLSFAAPEAADPAPSAYREPAYPFLVSVALRGSGAPLPASRTEVEGLLGNPLAWRSVRLLNWALVALAAVAAGAGAGRLAGAGAGWVAFAAVAASPALRSTATQLMSENLAAAHLAVAALALVGLARGERWARLSAVALLGTLPLTRSEGALLLPVALLVEAAAGRSLPAAVRRRRAALLALGLSLPGALWIARNARVTGHAVLSDRGGLALAVRAELDAEVGRQGALSAALAWTPLDAARRASRERSPDALWLDYRPVGPGNFYLRTLRGWQAERARPGADPLAVDAAAGRAALARFLRHPVEHAQAAAAVAWRGLFCELSPRWSHPFDLAFGLGLLLGGAVAATTWRAARRRDLAAAALLAPAWTLYLFHVAATELLPRYSTPLLPIAWCAVAVVVACRRA